MIVYLLEGDFFESPIQDLYEDKLPLFT